MLPPINVATASTTKETPLPSPNIPQSSKGNYTASLHSTSLEPASVSSIASSIPTVSPTNLNLPLTELTQDLAQISPKTNDDPISQMPASPALTIQINAPTVDNTPRSTLIVHSPEPSSAMDAANNESSVPAVIQIIPESSNAAPTIIPLTEEQKILLKEQRLNEIKTQCSTLISELDSDSDPEAVVRRHISQLTKYHELKDIALGLVTMIADQRHVRTTELLKEMKVDYNEE
ncbi:Swi5-domain-containing protein [Scheffersomyces xylosifermentans]|uniref:Swi5-domain-containing protein n=1 Tax=Scheffersomyces xylosifermentans TaxID=1304137 RepID=UPI00315C6A4E